MCFYSNQYRHDPYRILSIDVKRAFFYAPSRRPLFVEIPLEDFCDGDEDMVTPTAKDRAIAFQGTRVYVEWEKCPSMSFCAGFAPLEVDGRARPSWRRA